MNLREWLRNSTVMPERFNRDQHGSQNSPWSVTRECLHAAIEQFEKISVDSWIDRTNEHGKRITAIYGQCFQQYLGEHKLMGTRCTKCGAMYLPPRAICPACHSDQLEWIEMSGKGKLAAFSSVFIGPSAMQAEGYDRTNPYCAGVVELDEGVKISARVLGVDAKQPDEHRHRHAVDGRVPRSGRGRAEEDGVGVQDCVTRNA